MPDGKRWPAAVYDHGEEPDPRFSLANERTFLAWLRTSLGLLAGAAALEALDLPMAAALQSVLGVVLALAGLVAAVSAWRSWANRERALREHTPLPANPAGVVILGAAVVVALALAVSAVVG